SAEPARGFLGPSAAVSQESSHHERRLRVIGPRLRGLLQYLLGFIQSSTHDQGLGMRILSPTLCRAAAREVQATGSARDETPRESAHEIDHGESTDEEG